MPTHVKNIKIIGLHDRFDIYQDFAQKINIIYGKNGIGKTTLLHILANVLNGDYERFFYLDFKSIKIQMDDDVTIKVERENHTENTSNKTLIISRSDQKRHLRISQQKSEDELDLKTLSHLYGYDPILPVAYFPAFRTMIEAWVSSLEEKESRDQLNRELPELQPPRATNILHVQTTRFSRRLFGQFVPQIVYPSPLEIEQGLIDEIREAILTVARVYREVLSQNFVDILATLYPLESINKEIENQELVLEQIKKLSEEIQNSPFQQESMLAGGVDAKIREMLHSFQVDDRGSRQFATRILSVYRDSLKKIVDIQKKSFAGIERYLASVNEFLEGKKLEVCGGDKKFHEPVELKFDDDSSSGLKALSSGERQIITLIYAATYMSQQNLVLIDEPEISLHVDWQRPLLKKMSEQLPNRQIIACTHSPMIAADYEECLMELKLTPTDKNLWRIDDKKDEDDSLDENAIVDEDDWTNDDEEEVLS